MKGAVIISVGLLVLQCISLSAAAPCDPRCTAIPGQGTCQSSGRCLCWWGWTGPNGEYVLSGFHKNRVLADYCTRSCLYTPRHRNKACVKIPSPPQPKQTSTANPSTQPTTGKPSTGSSTKAPPTVSCDPKCTATPGQGTCQSDGKCLCWWGWTGPNAEYILSGTLKNRIMADYCTEACHYTHDYMNASCASIPTPKVCSLPGNTTDPPIPCDPLCGTGTYHSAGKCLSNGRCLCWWGWTGSNACYIDGGSYNNRIIADRCTKACHYTHDHRNINCTKYNSTNPSTQPPVTRKPSTGRITTGVPTSGAYPQSSTRKLTTAISTTASSKTHPTTPKETSTIPTTAQRTTKAPTTKERTTSHRSTTAKATTTQKNSDHYSRDNNNWYANYKTKDYNSSIHYS